jgi:hypothetical protein
MRNCSEHYGCVLIDHQIGITVPNTTSQILAIQRVSQLEMDAREGEQRTSHSKAQVEVFVVMSQVVFLHLAHVLRQLRVMQPFNDR